MNVSNVRALAGDIVAAGILMTLGGIVMVSVGKSLVARKEEKQQEKKYTYNKVWVKEGAVWIRE